jgi:isopentenyl diphosphate isomerase/L-lactate dehydrogenase-like FMN-dependent dehydrogenase
MTRRDAASYLARFCAASPILVGAQSSEIPPIDSLINVFDFDQAAKARLAKPAYDYVSGGGWDEVTLKRNRDMYQKILLLPRFFEKVDKLDLSTEIFGLKLPFPIAIAPTGTHGMIHPDGELATVRGAGKLGALMAVSTSSSFPIAKIGAEAKSPLWFQLYTGPDPDGTRERVENALAAGCKAVCVTVDAPYQAPRERDTRNNWQRIFPEGKEGRRPRRYSEEEPNSPYGLPMRYQATLDWTFLEQLAKWFKAPILVKGILTGADARRAADHGAQGVIVSNHGGRYLDGVPSTIEVLPEVVAAVGGRIPVLLDGGVRRGTDALKALALGAKVVFVGRPPLWGLGAYGQPGVEKVLTILRNELAWAMGLAGRSTIRSIDSSLIRIEN